MKLLRSDATGGEMLQDGKNTLAVANEKKATVPILVESDIGI